MPSSSTTAQREASIAGLGRELALLSTEVESYLRSSLFEAPSFKADKGSVPVTAKYQALRASINNAAWDLLDLVNGPRDSLRNYFYFHYDLAALQVALDRRLFEHVTLPAADARFHASGGSHGRAEDDGSSVAEVSARAGMDEDRTARILKLLATHRIFETVTPNDGGSSSRSDSVGQERFRHTACSALLGRDANFRAYADMQMDDALKAASETSALIARDPFVSGGQMHSAYVQRFGVPAYQYLEQNPSKGARFAQAMSTYSQWDNQLADLRDGFSWGSLGDGLVVDVGGGNGHVSLALAREFTSLRFLVQDISANQMSQAQLDPGDGLRRPEGDSASSRVTFEQHDFFTPQPVRSASVFFLRQVLHNYADADAVRILRALVPAMERCEQGDSGAARKTASSSLLINEVVLPESGAVKRFEEHRLRQLDLCMLVALGAKQRTAGEFKELLQQADERFEVVSFHASSDSLSLIEVRFDTK